MKREFNQEIVASILEKGIDLSIGDVISKGWEVCKSRIWSLIGFSFLFLLIAIVGLLINIIPIIGTIVYIVGLISLGLGYYVFITKHENGATFSDFFKGFPFLGQSILATLIIYLLQLPVFFLSFSSFNFDELMSGDIQRIAQAILQAQQTQQSTIMIILGFVSQLYSAFISLIYLFVNFLIVDKEANFWQAMKASRKVVMNKMGFFIVLMLVLVLINVLGALFFLLGLFVTIPLSFCVMYVVYKEIFGSEFGNVFEDRISSFGR